MESKILLYDAENNKIGETFARRARQLIKQQRAQWTDETQRAVRFLPGAQHLNEAEEAPFAEEGFTSESPTGEKLSSHEKKLLRLAEARIYYDNLYKFLWRVYLTVNALLVGIWFFTGRGYFWPIWPIAGWGAGLIIVGFVFKMLVVPPIDHDEMVKREYDYLKKVSERVGN